LGVGIRHSARRGTPVSTILVVVSLVGTVGLGGLSYLRLGTLGGGSTTLPDLAVMLLAGICNAAAFLTLTKALELARLVHVSALGASQVAMAAVAGVVLFNEPPSAPLALGVMLTVAGLLGMKRRGVDTQGRNQPTQRESDPIAGSSA
jgi:drug/metabolite transporter (DMT)-like permease